VHAFDLVFTQEPHLSMKKKDTEQAQYMDVVSETKFFSPKIYCKLR